MFRISETGSTNLLSILSHRVWHRPGHRTSSTRAAMAPARASHSPRVINLQMRERLAKAAPHHQSAHALHHGQASRRMAGATSTMDRACAAPCVASITTAPARAELWPSMEAARTHGRGCQERQKHDTWRLLPVAPQPLRLSRGHFGDGRHLCLCSCPHRLGQTGEKDGVSRHQTGAQLHAFAIVGYDDEGFWIQNSWGTGWGERAGALGIQGLGLQY